MRKELLGSPEHYVELDRKFHECIYQGSQNEVLADAIRKLQIRLWPIYRVRLTLLQNARQSYSEHDQIVSAIGAGDVIASQLAMRAHMSSSALMLERLHGKRARCHDFG
jgi:DNA-binding GntR family transcriptional regulator